MFFSGFFKRKYRSISHAAKDFWVNSQSNSKVKQSPVCLQLESLEERAVPTVSVTVNGSTLEVENDNVNEAIAAIGVNPATSKLVIVTAVNAPVNVGGGSVAANVWTSDDTVDVIGLERIVIDNGTAGDLSVVNLVNLANANDLRQVDYFGSEDNDVVLFNTNNNDNVYLRFNGGGGEDTLNTSSKGVNLVQFTDATNPSSLELIVGDDSHKVALDFSRLTDASGSVNINLGEPNEIIGGYKNMTVKVADAGMTQFIDALVGGPGNDLLIGNGGDNLLIGRDGSDTLIGNGGNDQLNANRDFSPDVDGNPEGQDGSIAGGTYDNDDDLTQFAATNAAFAGQDGISPTSEALYALFGFYGFGEGTTDFAASFATANALNSPESNDQLNGGDGNDGLFGFNNARVTVFGGAGNDIFSTNENGLESLVDMGEGDDTVYFVNGDTVFGGSGNDLITPAAYDASKPNALTFLFGEEDDDVINAGQEPDEIRPGTGVNTIGGDLSNDTLIGEGGTDTVNGNPLVQI